MAALDVIVMVLDDDANALTTPWGWRGRIVFRGRWDAAPVEIARATSRRLGDELQVHAVVHYRGVDWIVLRWATEYRCAGPAASTPPASGVVSHARVRAAAPAQPRKVAAGRGR